MALVEPPPLPLPKLLRFAAASAPVAAVSIAVSVYLPQHFARDLGLDLVLVGAAFALVRLIDIPLDPLLGLAMDRTHTRWGRYRVWMALGAPALMLTVGMLFMTSSGVGLAYLVGWLLVMYLAISMLSLGHSAWAAKLATGYTDRARMFGVMGAVGVLGSILILAIPILLRMSGLNDGALTVRAMGWFILSAAPLAVLLVLASTSEPLAPPAGAQAFELGEYRALLFRPTMGRIVLADLLLALAPGWESALYVFFTSDYMGYGPSQVSVILMVSIAAGFVGAPTWARVAGRIGKHRAVMLAAVAYSGAVVLFTLVGKGHFPIGLGISAAAGFIMSGFVVLLRSMTADVADEVRLEQGKERAGLLFALTTTTNKMAGAFSIWLTFTLLAQVGYEPNAGSANSAEAVATLALVYASGPILFALLGAVCMIGYGLGPERTAEIRRLLAEREHSTAVAVRPDVRVASHSSQPDLAP